MAFLNPYAADQDKANAEKYEELKKFLSSKDENQKLNKFLPALMHMQKMEIELEKKDKEIAKFRQFFNLLNEITRNLYSL